MDDVLKLVKLDLGITDKFKEDLLTLYINKCVYKITDITKQSEEYILKNLTYVVADLVIIMYNRRGTEGLNSQSSNGMNESYLNDIPRDIKKQLYAHRKLGGLR